MLSVYWATFEKLFDHTHGNIIVYIIVANNYSSNKRGRHDVQINLPLIMFICL